MGCEKIRVAIVGLGNCASSLIQGITYYGRSRDGVIGLMHPEIGGYRPWDIEVVAAFDIDRRKVGKDVSEAIFAPPNCTQVFCPDVSLMNVPVRMGNILDGFAEHMTGYRDSQTFLPKDGPQATQKDVVQVLRDSGAEMVLNYLPVGSEEATRFYAECALEAGAGLINNIPAFIASNSSWAARFEEKNLPVIGDDIKSQMGATIVHRALSDLFRKRGVKLDRTYQLNTGGNTDFLNMLNRTRLASKKESKTEAVQSVLAERLVDDNIHIGPSDFVPWQKDNKLCFIRMEGKIFGDIAIHLDLKLSVEDSPNSAGVVIDCIRCCKHALNLGQGGVLEGPSSFFMKHPPKQFSDEEAYRLTEAFIARTPGRMAVVKRR